MPYNKDRLERFVMQAGTISQSLPTFGGTVEIDAIGNSLGFSPEDSRSIAVHLENIGWATLHTSDPIGAASNPKLTITPRGYDEIAKLNRPRLHRWIDAHPKTISCLIFFAGIGASLIAEFIKRLIWPTP